MKTFKKFETPEFDVIGRYYGAGCGKGLTGVSSHDSPEVDARRLLEHDVMSLMVAGAWGSRRTIGYLEWM